MTTHWLCDLPEYIPGDEPGERCPECGDPYSGLLWSTVIEHIPFGERPGHYWTGLLWAVCDGCMRRWGYASGDYCGPRDPAGIAETEAALSRYREVAP